MRFRSKGRLRKAAGLLAMLLVVVALALASDPWKDKPYRKWNKKDVEKVLKQSPWTKSVTIAAKWLTLTPLSNNPLNRPGVSPQSTTNTSVGGAQGGPGSLGMQLEEPTAKFTALWVSSLTVREAILRRAVLAGKLSEAAAQADVAQAPGDYEITISGLDMTPFSGLSNANLLAATYLETKEAKQRVTPRSVDVEMPAKGSRPVRVTFHFPVLVDDKPSISAKEKEADLICKLKQANLKFRFELEKMATKQGRDL